MMFRTILVVVLAVGVVATGYWGYQEHQEKNSVLIKAENNYQRAFHDLTYHLDQLHDEIGSTLAMNTRKQLSPSLAEVWRISSMAQSELGQLPLTLMPFSKTEEYLYKIGNFTYRNAIRDLDKDELTEEEYKTLEQLYEQSGEIQAEMRKVQSMVLKDNLRWMDVELALASEDEPLDNAIVITKDGVLNPGGLRYEDEFVRHKMLDLIGDLKILNKPIKGHLVAVKAGHAINNDFAKELEKHNKK